MNLNKYNAGQKYQKPGKRRTVQVFLYSNWIPYPLSKFLLTPPPSPPPVLILSIILISLLKSQYNEEDVKFPHLKLTLTKTKILASL